MDHPRCNRAAPLLLNARNYHTWSQKTKMILTREKMWHVVQDTPPITRTQKWMENNEQALACIGLLVEDKYLVDIRDHTEAHSAWKHLSQLYGQYNMQTRMLLNKTLFTTRYRPGTDMSEHLAEMMNISSRLRDLGHPLDEPLLCSAILCSLPTEFATLITTIESSSDSSLSTDTIRAKITEEANRQKLQKGERSKPVVALITDTEPVNRQRTAFMECYYCHKRGHLKRDCRLRKTHESHEGLSDATRRNTYHRTFSSPTQPDYTSEEDDKATPKAYHIQTCTPRIMTMKSTTEMAPYEWIIDTGASEHICHDPNLLQNFSTPEQLPMFQTADGKNDRAVGVGSCLVTLTGENGQSHQLKLFPVYYLPQITDNLISVRKLDQLNYLTTFLNGRALISLGNETWILGQACQGLYRTIHIPNERIHLCNHVIHDQMGHPNHKDLKTTIELSQAATHLKQENQGEWRCKVCLQTKLTNAPFKTREQPNTRRAFEMLHSDLCGPIKPTTLGGNSYVLTITDDYTKYSVVRLLKHKDEASLHIQYFIEEHSARFGRSPYKYRTDGGGEFCNTELKNYFRRKGIQHQITVPHTPQENGLSERTNRTLFDSTRAILKSSKLPKSLWGEIIKTSSYLHNLTIRKHLKITPFEAWMGSKPTYQHLHPIGTQCVYLNTSPTRGKLDDRGIEGSLVGYGPSRHMYHIWDPRKNTIQISRRVVFLDKPCTHCSYPDNNTCLIPNIEPIQGDTIDDSSGIPLEVPQVRRSKRDTLGKAPQKLTYDSQMSPTYSESDWYSHKKLNQ